MKKICVIPARMGSSRFPGKPIKPLLGMPMIEHIAKRCALCESFDYVIIATCDEEIREAGEKAGFQVVMTHDQHPGCVDRTSEAISKLDFTLAEDDLVLMVQGDEMMVTPDMLQQVVDKYEETKAPVINIISLIEVEEDKDSPNTVKIVAAPDGRGLYLSRSCIPCLSRAKEDVPIYQQTGIIGFQRAFLDHFLNLPRTPLEMVELVDMLRVLENGYELQTIKFEKQTVGVDTPEELARVEEMLLSDPVAARYMKPEQLQKAS